MAPLLDLMWFLAGMAFIEGLLKPFVVQFTQRQAKKLLPEVLNIVDDQLPTWLGTLKSAEIEEKVLSIVDSVAQKNEVTLTESGKQDVLSKAITAYSFLVNAEKLINRQ